MGGVYSAEHGTGKRKQIDPESSDQCPYCEEVESYEHVFECRRNSSAERWESVNKGLLKNNTAPLIRNALRAFYFGNDAVRCTRDAHGSSVNAAIQA